ncbi:hypothetical protein N825_06705 [Skermanella stibiiresistens SB22]|uniref:SEC-C motif-containing protein n=1 Tax=Skermanella stibiiresistens SB22 TaxID=1385369 RepID=W9GZX8_9PROT|nr:DUF1186 domain-containing protein [Skermanella stibiiresistens]EWY39490.1 hypothetical protein N825_06705 [Skermanella stibiiresistens SB22]
MDCEQIIAAFRGATTVPADAVRQADQQREAMIPILTGIVTRSAEAPLQALAGDEGLVFLAVHLLGSWRATAAYRPVADLLGREADKVDALLGDAVPVTIHRVMFNLFDGAPDPLMALIESPVADCHTRRRMLDTMGMLTVAGRLERRGMMAYLGGLHGALANDPHGIVVSGWAELIAQLGMVELRGLVERGFRAGQIDPLLLAREDFARMLADAVAGEPMAGVGDEFRPFGDVVMELDGWMIRDEDAEIATITQALRHREPALAGWDIPGFLASPAGLAGQRVASNPYRYVGRNDPCPCGSGAKFKKCCGRWR